MSESNTSNNNLRGQARRSGISWNANQDPATIQCVKGGYIGITKRISTSQNNTAFTCSYDDVKAKHSILQVRRTDDEKWIRQRPFDDNNNNTATINLDKAGIFEVSVLTPMLNQSVGFFMQDDGQCMPYIRNVALFKSRGGKTCASIDFVTQTTLKTKVESLDKSKTFSPYYCRVLLSQIAHAVHRIHKSGLVHGDITPANIYFAKDEDRVVLTDSFSNNLPATNKDDDIKALASVFYFVLRKDKTAPLTENLARSCTTHHLLCEDPRLAIDLLQEMTRDKPITAEKFLQHPFFWSCSKKIQFIVLLVNAFTGEKADENVSHSPGQVFTDNWVDILEISPDELEALEINKKKLSVGEVKEWALQWIQNIAMFRARRQIKTKRKRNEGIGESEQDELKNSIEEDLKKSFHHLLRFIRNFYTHLNERSLHMKKMFEDLNNMWPFLYRRYPNLLAYIYKKMEDRCSTDKRFKEFYSVCEEEPLPQEKVFTVSDMEFLYQERKNIDTLRR